MTRSDDIPAILDQLCEIYDTSAANLRRALDGLCQQRRQARSAARADGCFAYPELRIDYEPAAAPTPSPARAFARLNQPGIYATSIARPALMQRISAESSSSISSAIMRSTSRSAGRRAKSPIPMCSTAPRSSSARSAPPSCRAGSRRASWSTSATRSPTAPGTCRADTARPLALFDGPRTDFSLARLRHYTGTPPEHFQHFVLFTNYVRYVDEFVALRDRRAAARRTAAITRFPVPGGLYRPRRADRRGSARSRPAIGAGTRCRPTI